MIEQMESQKSWTDEGNIKRLGRSMVREENTVHGLPLGPEQARLTSGRKVEQACWWWAGVPEALWKWLRGRELAGDWAEQKRAER